MADKIFKYLKKQFARAQKKFRDSNTNLLDSLSQQHINMPTTPTLPGTVAAAAPGLKGFDADSVISAATAQEFAQQGYAFCARYLSLGQGQASGDLSNSEATNILNGGLALIAVQHVPYQGWVPSASLGTEYGTNAASNAASIGLKQGMNIWCDLEGIASGTSSSVVIDYCQAWYNAVEAAGYIPGLYVGANCILNSEQLYDDLSFQHYWQSLSNVPMVATRGYQLVQSEGGTVNGIGIDNDITQTDNLGGNVLWLSPTA